MTAEDFFESEQNPINEIDKKGAYFGYSQLLQFAESYAESLAKERAVEFMNNSITGVSKEMIESWYDTFLAEKRKEFLCIKNGSHRCKEQCEDCKTFLIDQRKEGES